MVEVTRPHHPMVDTTRTAPAEAVGSDGTRTRGPHVLALFGNQPWLSWLSC